MPSKSKTLQISLGLLILLGLSSLISYNQSSPLAITAAEAKQKLINNEFDEIVDVRTDLERATGYYPGSIHIPRPDIPEKLPQIIPDRDTRILFYCNTSTRARMAAEDAKKLGYHKIRYLLGTHIALYR